MCPGNHDFGAVGNFYGHERALRFDNILATQSTGVVRVLSLHHHPFIVNDPFMDFKDAQALARAVYGRIDLILFGRKHTMNQWENLWGSKYVLASDNSPGKNFAKEITIDKTGVLPPKSVPIAEAGSSVRSLTSDKSKGKKSPSSS
jgi:hypothetical protein